MTTASIIRTLVPCLIAGAAFCADIPQVDIHGFVSQGYLKTNKNDYLGETQSGTFDFNEAAVNLQSQLTSDLRVGVQLFARDLDGIGQDRVAIDWAYADYHYRDELGIRFGQVKVARGLYNEYFDLDLANPTVLLPQSVYDERLRDFLTSTEGASVYGTLGSHQAGSLDYEVFCGTRSLDSNGSVAGFFRNAFYNKAAGQDYTSNSVTLRRMYGGSLTWNTPVRGLRANGSVLAFDHLEGSGTLTGYAPVPLPVTLDVSKGKNMVVGAEYTNNRLRLASELTIWNLNYNYLSTIGVSRWAGWYVQAAYQLTPKWEVAATYGEFYNDRLDRDGEHFSDPRQGFQKDTSLCLRYDPMSWMSIKAEGHYIRGWTQMFGQDNPNGFDGDTIMLALKATVSF